MPAHKYRFRAVSTVLLVAVVEAHVALAQSGITPLRASADYRVAASDTPDLPRQRVTRAGRTDARRLGTGGRDGPRPHPATEQASRLPPSRNLRRTPPQPSATATFPTLVW